MLLPFDTLAEYDGHPFSPRACPQRSSRIAVLGRRIHSQHFIILINNNFKNCLKMVVLTLEQKRVLGLSTGWGKWDFWIHLKSLTPPSQSLIPRKCPVTGIIAA